MAYLKELSGGTTGENIGCKSVLKALIQKRI